MFTVHIHEKPASGSSSLLFTREVKEYDELSEIYSDFCAGHYTSYVDGCVTGWSFSRDWESDDVDLYIETVTSY